LVAPDRIRPLLLQLAMSYINCPMIAVFKCSLHMIGNKRRARQMLCNVSFVNPVCLSPMQIMKYDSVCRNDDDEPVRKNDDVDDDGHET
jgi:hypothetical protein